MGDGFRIEADGDLFLGDGLGGARRAPAPSCNLFGHVHRRRGKPVDPALTRSKFVPTISAQLGISFDNLGAHRTFFAAVGDLTLFDRIVVRLHQKNVEDGDDEQHRAVNEPRKKAATFAPGDQPNEQTKQRYDDQKTEHAILPV
ncbi:MAG TPA: hypothetical protein VFF98_17255 [Novosphingobium sp.]|nr:hypothetical protein [Novosphingobium sp.]